MINVSSEFKKTMETRTDFKCAAVITFVDGSTLELTEDDFSVSNNSLIDAAGLTQFPLGAAIQRAIQIELMNDDERYAGYSFLDAEIILYLTFKLSSGTERVTVGTFTVTQPETYGDTVIITAQDDMYKADKPYSTSLTYPTALYNVFKECCDKCGILTSQGSFRNSDFVVASAPPADLTYRAVLGYAAMIAGGNARISRNRRLEIITYDFETLTNARNDYEALHAVDTTGAGNVTLISESVVCTDNNGAVTIPQGGEFTDSGNGHITGAQLDTGIHDLRGWFSLNVETDDIIITGLQTTVTITDPDTGEATESTILRGEEGYTLTISNPLISGKEEQALALIGNVMLGAQFRKFSGDYYAYPLAEFMDLCKITDRKGRLYYSVITDVNFVWFGVTTLSNSAEPPLRNSAQYVSMETRANITAQKAIAREKTERELAIQALSDALASAGGLYSTEDVQPDGSIIYYLHDKPTLATSRNVIKLTSEALGLSTDGGQTYPCGVYVNGDVIANILRANGISADWINTGALTVKNDAGVTLFSIDKDNGTVYISGDCITFKGQSLEYTIDNKADAATAIGSVDVLYGLSGSATDPSDIVNWSTTAPAWVDGKYMWQKTVTYYADHKASNPHYVESDPTCLTGATGAEGSDGTGVSSITNYYLATSASSGVTTETAGWTTAVQSMTSINRFLWNYEVIAYTNGKNTTSSPCIIGVYGEKGDTGNPGATGATGNGIASVTEYYAVSTSDTTAPTTWHTTLQTMTAVNKYLWNYEVVTYTDGTSAETIKRVIGVYGDTGDTGATGSSGLSAYQIAVTQGYTGTEAEWLASLAGADGTNGTDGRGITSVVTYYLATNLTQAPLSCADLASDGNIALTSPSIACTDASGSGGVTIPPDYGVSATDANTGEITLSVEGVTLDTPGWTTTLQQVDASHKYLWMYEEITYTDGTITKTQPVCLATYTENGKSAYEVAVENGYVGTEDDWLQSLVGADGAQGIPGTPGANGNTSYLHIAYATSADGSTGFSTTDSANKTYIGQYTDFTAADSTNPADYSWTLIKGADGADGRGITSVVNYYLATSASSGVTTETAGWTTTVQNVTTAKKYLWNYEVINYTSGAATTSSPCIIGAYGDTGGTGATGNGISTITEYYAVNNSNDTAPTKWYTTLQTMTTTNRYLWNYEVITYTNGGTETTTARVIGVYGDTGEQGATGVGWRSVQELYYLSTSSTNAPSAPTSRVTSTSTAANVWTTKCPTWRSGYYYWTCSQMLKTDGTYTWSTVLLASGLNSANTTAKSANDTATTANNTANEAVTVTRKIELTSFVFDEDGMHVFSGATEKITVGSDGVLTAKDAVLTGIITTGNVGSGPYAQLSDMGLYFRNNDQLASFYILPWLGYDTDNYGLACTVSPDNDNVGSANLPYLAFGISHGGDPGFTPAYVLNNGLDPDGYTERNIFYGATRFVDAVTMASLSISSLTLSALTLNGNAVADVIVQTGTSGNWVYRKWSSGVSECYGYYDVSNVACTTASGALYVTGNINPNMAFPSGVFIEKTMNCQMTFNSYQGTPAFVWIASGINSSSGATPFRLMRQTSATISGRMQYYYRGWWK